MGKNNRSKKSSDFLSHPAAWVIIILGIVLVAVVIYCAVTGMPWGNKADVDSTSTSSSQTTPPTEDDDIDSDAIMLDRGLFIREIQKYSGKYMEDGSNEKVSDVMMLIVENTNVQDLQLARIYITYEDTTAEFQVTNLPAGESAVLLEQNKQAFVDEKYLDIRTENVVFFSEPMSMHEDKFEISSSGNTITIKNISQNDISGDIYIYYKNSSKDLFYGGITYRVKVSDGLKAGEIKQVSASHYSPDACKLLMVNFGG